MAAFLFGKLPAHGDFVARGLCDADRVRWDAWGSAAVAALRAAAGEAFEAVHGAAPPWRFVTGGGERWIAGALAPSVDGAGRRFLLALGCDGLAPALAGAGGLAFAAEAEALIYEGLAEGLDADALLARARERFAAVEEALRPPAAALAARPAGPGAWWTLGGEAAAPACLAAGEAPHDLLARTLAPARSPEAVR